jgi:hypothetical protein
MTERKAKPRNRDTKVEHARLVLRPLVEAGLAVNPKWLSASSGFSEPTLERAYDWERCRAEERQTLREELRTELEAELRAELRAELAAVQPTPAPAAPPVVNPIQEKLSVLEARMKQRLQYAFEDKVLEEVKRRINENVLPYYKNKLATAELVMKAGRPFTNQEYISLLRAFHPDSSSPEYRTAAFRLIKEKEPLLRPEEKDKPLTSRLPKTWAEVVAMQQKREPRTRAKGSRKNASETV